jgi:hypothetical protein
MKSPQATTIIFCLWVSSTASAFVVRSQHQLSNSFLTKLYDSDPIISPFDNSDKGSEAVATESTVEAPDKAIKIEGPLDLTWENVDLVLDEMRPFLIQDGGNVAIADIDGPVVRLELQVCIYLCDFGVVFHTILIHLPYTYTFDFQL